MKIKYSCLRCGKTVERYDSCNNGKFCSNKCQGQYSLEKRLVLGTTFDKGIRKWCYDNLEQICGECGQGTEWNGKLLRLQVDHKNGNIRDNRRENLRMICPNCHTQTENWGVKNASEKGREKMRAGAEYCRKQKLKSKEASSNGLG